jgi:hypothetical protein
MNIDQYEDLHIDEVHCNNGVFRIAWSMPFPPELAELGMQTGQVDVKVDRSGYSIDAEGKDEAFCTALLMLLVTKYYKQRV